MAIDPAEQQRLMADWPQIPDTAHTFQAGASAPPQQAYGDVRPLIAQQPRDGWRSVAEMVASVERAYPEGAVNRMTRVAEDGSVWRLIESATGDPPIPDERGVLMVPKRRQWIPVALTQTAARTASAAGNRTDYWNGWSWVKEGVKTERDRPAMAATVNREQNTDIVYEPASPAEQARYRAQVAAQQAVSGIPLVPPVANLPVATAPAPEPARKSKAAL